ncbi:phenylalanine--tRNA ligase subunit beta [Pseudactinotalea sp. HY158]|uniref:phenylalanine--tRNA ligase subunit beta n=1 Tax=Pseudactinotalea sp. HY158 TaxID=2654547 RepID=UPI00129CB75B|nr:phenylalanine--tRNA ligase subunit beta [Pseudactinotalea sp. HY158]QGH69029.1 phenylalanine--tRNA ligase subunit beta [Pseudactinotalea sp. HY158]
MPYVPLSWLRDHVAVPADATPETLAADLVRVGLEEEGIDTSAVVTGPLVVGRVLELTPEPQKNGKTINWCRVDVGDLGDETGSRGIVCGAHNFAVGDAVVVALPGAVLPGDFAIAARKTYGHVSDGMICSQRELGLGEDHDGIVVLPEPAPAPGTDALALLGLGEAVLEINVTPDRGYCFSMRGVAREYSHSTGAAFTDPGLREVPSATASGFPVTIEDDAPIHGLPGCDRFVTRIVRGIDPAAPTPDWMVRRLNQAGMRPISLAVDVTNYVMLDLGQPLHAYDLATLAAPITVRRARAGERLVTLDDADRALDTGDLLITDAGGASGGHAGRILGIAGVMGGAETEVGERTRDVLIEAAHFDPITIARSARRHKLPSEAAKRFERGVDTALQAVAADRVVELLVELAGGTAEGDVFDLDRTAPPATITMDAQLPSRIAGVAYTDEEVIGLLRDLGATVEVTGDGAGRHRSSGATLHVTPPTWRSDLVAAEHLVEEVVRLHGYDKIPSILPTAPAGRGYTPAQKRRRAVATLLADLGLVEVLTYPFTSAERHDELGLPAGDPRRSTLRLVNPLAADRPLLRSHLLATLVDAAVRNLGRGTTDLAIYEIASVPVIGGEPSASPLPPHAVHPPHETLAAIRAAVPAQPLHVAALLAGNRRAAGVDPAGSRAAAGYDHADAIALAGRIAEFLHVEVSLSAATDRAPWHPGRCAAFTLSGGRVIGHAGELTPKVTQALGLPDRACALELDLTALLDAAPAEPRQLAGLATYPPVKEDIALVVDAGVPASEVLSCVRTAGGELLEQVRLFDVYSGDSVAGGRKSLAFGLRLRAHDRTLTAAESAAVREAIVAAAAERFGATLRA